MGLFTRGQPPQAEETPPPFLDDLHSYQAGPGSNGTDASRSYNADVPSLDDSYFPTVPNSYGDLTHYDRPPPDETMQAWWEERDQWGQAQRKLEQFKGTFLTEDHRGLSPLADDPRWDPPRPTRWTSYASPSSWSYTRPFGQDMARDFTGLHMSLANNHVGYNLRGRSGQTSEWRNTNRLDPPNNDATAVYVGDSVALDTTTSYVVQPDGGGGMSSSYRL